MFGLRLHRFLIALVVALLLGAGPGSPLCKAGLTGSEETMSMAGCDQSMPKKKFDPTSHSACISACIGLEQENPIAAGHIIERPLLSLPIASPLNGMSPDPEIEPPRIDRA
jgi:hypothetical protein